MIKISDVCILLAVMVSFCVSAYLWFNGQREEGLFTATCVPSIFCFGMTVLGLVLTVIEFRRIPSSIQKLVRNS